MFIFIDNKYTHWYYAIICKAQSRLIQHTYTESHHIIPKSLGGSNKKENLVKLTAREHFVCHWLLTKMVAKCHQSKMLYALYCMTHVKTNDQIRYLPSARKCSEFKGAWRNSIQGRQAHNKGKPMSEEQKLKLREANLGKTYTRSEEYLQKQSLAQKGKSRGKGRVSNRKGIKMSEEQKQKIRESMLRRKRSI